MILIPRKEDAECCQAHALPDGRLPIGYCSPECIRRPSNWRYLESGGWLVGHPNRPTNQPS